MCVCDDQNIPYLKFQLSNSYTLSLFNMGCFGRRKHSQTKKEKNKKKKYHHNTCHTLSNCSVSFNEQFLPIFKIPVF